MKMVKAYRIAAVLGLTLALDGCFQPTGPVFGDWTGRQPLISINQPSFVDLVLLGLPGAREGQYQIKANQTDATLSNSGARTLRWSNRWTLQPGPTPDAPQLLVLHNLPNSQISRYVLFGNGVLVPLGKNGQPDTSNYGLQYALKPVPKSNYSYGRV
ncbi:hypothetical protein [Lichenicoccus sp.]|uniref:hypothetical protein n=1 Tax=Lichenicoccus sp. TaxID=2781899 RepID=UPI003D0B48F2